MMQECKALRLWTDRAAWVRKGAHAKLCGIDVEGLQSIAVIKHAGFGDMVLTRPFLVTLRRYFPRVKIVLSVLSIYRRGVPHDLIDDLHVVDRAERSPVRVYRNYRDLGEHDLLFDLSATTRSYWITYVNRAGLKVGFIERRRIHRLVYDVAVPRTDYRFEAETFLDQLLVLGLSYEWPLAFDLEAERPDVAAPYLVYFPTASVTAKCWPADRFSSLVGLLAAEFPHYDHVILAGTAPWEKETCQRIRDAVHQGFGARKNVKIVDPEGDPLGWVAGAELVVSNDTGIRNLAIAAGTPTVGIFFATLPFRYLPRFGRHEAVYRLDRAPPSVEHVRFTVRKVLATIAPR